jgi:hypothetical protein
LKKNPWELNDINNIDIDSIKNLEKVDLTLFYHQLKWSTENILENPSST